MEIFLSWSGERSERVAKALHRWLPLMIQAVRPWVSAKDIEKGAWWSSDLATHLELSHVGIICLTQENLEAPWLLFEAGAISKAIATSFVCPYLYGLKPADVKGPLSLYQATKADRDDTLGLVKTINKALEADALQEHQLEKLYTMLWPDLEAELESIPVMQHKEEPLRSERELIEELLGHVRYLRYKPNRDAPVTPPLPPHRNLSPDKIPEFFEKELLPDAINRARRDYEHISLANESVTLSLRAQELARQGAEMLGLGEEWDAWARERSK